MINYLELETGPGSRVVGHVVFELEKKDVILTLEHGVFGLDGQTWVARSGNGLRHFPDPEIALRRFVSPERAGRLIGAYLAFGGSGIYQSEESQIEVK